MERITISEITRDDLPYIHWVENLEEYWHINEHPGPYSMQEIADCFFPSRFYPLHKQQRWIIRKREMNVPIGILDAFDFNEKEMSIGVGILIPLSADQQRGFGNEAIQLLIKKLTFDPYIKKIFALIDKDNNASIKLFEKSGFSFVKEQICLHRMVNRYEKLL